MEDPLGEQIEESLSLVTTTPPTAAMVEAEFSVDDAVLKDAVLLSTTSTCEKINRKVPLSAVQLTWTSSLPPTVVSNDVWLTDAETTGKSTPWGLGFPCVPSLTTVTVTRGELVAPNGACSAEEENSGASAWTFPIMAGKPYLSNVTDHATDFALPPANVPTKVSVTVAAPKLSRPSKAAETSEAEASCRMGSVVSCPQASRNVPECGWIPGRTSDTEMLAAGNTLGSSTLPVNERNVMKTSPVEQSCVPLPVTRTCPMLPMEFRSPSTDEADPDSGAAAETLTDKPLKPNVTEPDSAMQVTRTVSMREFDVPLECSAWTIVARALG